jgi:REP element-mobilizing transposase RayT
MKTSTNYLASFYDGGMFHVYNRTNNKELLFTTDNNRLFFLKQYSKYLSPFVDTFCWCLLSNHFHFLIQVKSVEAIQLHLRSCDAATLKPIEKNYLVNYCTTELLLEFEWKRFFTSYAMAFNKQQHRKGNLFHRPFKRVEVDKASHFTQAVVYIHANAQHHKLCTNFTQYPWSSWHSIISNLPTQLKREEVINWFGGLQQLIAAHKGMTRFYNDAIGIEE